MIDAAEINQARIFGFQRNDHRRKIGALFGAFKAEDVEAELLGLDAKILRDTLAVKRLVVNDVDRLEFEILGREARPDRPLNVVPAANPVHVRIAAIGDLGRRVRRRNHRQHGVFVDFG